MSTYGNESLQSEYELRPRMWAGLLGCLLRAAMLAMQNILVWLHFTVSPVVHADQRSRLAPYAAGLLAPVEARKR